MLKKILIAVAVLIVVVFAALLAMPSDYRVERRITIDAPPQAVFDQLDVAKAWPNWMIWYEREPDMEKVFSGPERGKGATVTFTSKDGKGTYTITSSDPAKGTEYTMTFEGMSPADGSLSISESGTGTELVWAMYGEMDGLVGKMFVPLMDSMVGPDFQAGLERLKGLVEKK